MHFHVYLVHESISCHFKKIKCVGKEKEKCAEESESQQRSAMWNLSLLRMCSQLDSE